MAKLSKGLDYDHDSIYPNKKELSSSQVIGYYDDPANFHREYVIGIRRPTSKPMHIGKVFSAMYADRKFDWITALRDGGITNKRIYQVLGDVIDRFPVIPKKECEYPLRCSYRGWRFRATLDGYPLKRIDVENKTGTTEWTQQRADESVQVTFQYWVKWKKDKCLFDYCQLNWVDLRAKSNQFIKTFITERTVDQLVEFEKRYIDSVIDGIEAEDWG